MLIKLARFAKQTVSSVSFRSSRFKSHLILGMFSNKKQQQPGQGSQNGQKGPTVIEISKQQFLAMKQFLENIKLSMPTPNISPFSPSMNQSSTVLQPPRTGGNQKHNSTGEAYFSSEQHLLSFKLLKLSQPQHFASVFQENKSKSASIKLIILHRYVNLGGTIDKKSIKNEQKLAYEYLDDIKDKINQFEEHQLEQFLGLYVNLYSQMSSDTNEGERQFKNEHLPKLDIEKEESSFLLIKDPTHTNSRVLMLLLKFWEIQSDDINSKQFKQGMKKILTHYELKNQDDPVLIGEQTGEQYSLDEIAYIGIWAYFCDLAQYNAIPKLITGLRKIRTEKTESLYSKRVIKAIQIILQNSDRLSHPSAQILSKFDELGQQLVQFITGLTNQPLSLSRRQQLQESSGEEQQDIAFGFNPNQNSGQVSSLLHSCLLTLHQKPNIISVKLASRIVKKVLSNIYTYLEKISFLPLIQYCEYWQSCMVMFKLLKGKSPYIVQNDLYSLLNCFINKINIDEVLRSSINETTGAVIEELTEDTEKRIFESLVGFRVIIAPNFKTNLTSPNLKQDSVESVEKKQNVLRDLLTGYRRTIENMYRCGLITSSESSSIHNLIICCMVSEAYSLQNSEGATQGTHIRTLMSPAVREILLEFGVDHRKYGEYVKKLLQKYQGY